MVVPVWVTMCNAPRVIRPTEDMAVCLRVIVQLPGILNVLFIFFIYLLFIVRFIVQQGNM